MSWTTENRTENADTETPHGRHTQMYNVVVCSISCPPYCCLFWKGSPHHIVVDTHTHTRIFQVSMVQGLSHEFLIFVVNTTPLPVHATGVEHKLTVCLYDSLSHRHNLLLVPYVSCTMGDSVCGRNKHSVIPLLELWVQHILPIGLAVG